MQARIAILPGDGIGPEVTREATRVLRAISERWHHSFALSEGVIGGCAIDSFGTPLPDDVLRLCRESDAVLLGAVGGPKWDGPSGPRPEQGLLSLRREPDSVRQSAPGEGSSRAQPILAAPTRVAGRRRHHDGSLVRPAGSISARSVAKKCRPAELRSTHAPFFHATDEIERMVRVAAGLAIRRGEGHIGGQGERAGDVPSMARRRDESDRREFPKFRWSTSLSMHVRCD